MSDPGKPRWEYGINLDFVGKAVEAASGKAGSDAYLRDHMFAPLGMNDNRLQDHGLAAPAAVGMLRAARTDRWRRSRSSWNRIRNSTWVAAASRTAAITSSSPR